MNHINVFPVADSDTGTNLCLSLSATLGILGGDEEKHLGTMLAAVADALLDSARGNSGAIVAQFFQGMSDSAGEITRFTTYTFGKAVTLGSEYAHDALSKPREGTILSVIAAFSDSIAHQVSRAKEDGFLCSSAGGSGRCRGGARQYAKPARGVAQGRRRGRRCQGICRACRGHVPNTFVTVMRCPCQTRRCWTISNRPSHSQNPTMSLASDSAPNAW